MSKYWDQYKFDFLALAMLLIWLAPLAGWSGPGKPQPIYNQRLPNFHQIEAMVKATEQGRLYRIPFSSTISEQSFVVSFASDSSFLFNAQATEKIDSEALKTLVTHHGHTIYLNGVYLDLSAEACTNCPPQRVEVTASGESHFFYRYYLTIFHRWSERVVNRDARLARDQRDPRDFSWRTGILPYVQLSVTGIVEVVVQNGDEGSEIARVHFNIDEYNDDTEQRGWVTGIMKWSQVGQLEEALAQFNQTYEDTIDSPALLQSLVPVALNHMDHSALIRFLALPVPSTHYLR